MGFKTLRSPRKHSPKGKRITQVNILNILYFDSSHQKSSNLSALYHLEKEFMLMGIVGSWGVWERVQCFMCNSETHKEAQLPELGSDVLV